MSEVVNVIDKFLKRKLKIYLGRNLLEIYLIYLSRKSSTSQPVLLISRKVLVLKDQCTSPCSCPLTSSPCPWTTKSLSVSSNLKFLSLSDITN